MISIDDDGLATLLDRHAELESKYSDGDGGRFLSGWQCQNPWESHIKELFGKKARRSRATNISISIAIPPS